MKILAVITLEPSAEAFISDQLSYFHNKLGWECHLICSSHPRLEAFAKEQGIQYQEINLERRFSAKNWVENFRVILHYMKIHKFDVLLAHSFPSACLLSMTAGKLAGITHRIEIAHGALQEGLKGVIQKCVILSERHNSQLSEVVVSVSPSVCKRRLFDKIDKEEKQRLLGKGTSNGVDSITKFNPANITESETLKIKEKYGIEPDDFVIGYCGRLVRDKGTTELISAYQKLKQRNPDKSIKLMIIGHPEKRDGLPEETLNLINTLDGIIFTGPIPYEDIQKYYTPMNIFILPSYREGFPTVVLEASAMGLPVITTRKTGCIDSIVENETGLFTDIAPNAIADTIEKLFDKQKAEQMGRNGREWVVNNFDHTIVREAMLNLIKELTEEKQ